MLFLLAKILVLMIGAALFGGLYVHWRLTRRYEDVTSEFARMRSEGLAWRHTVDGYLQKIARSATVDLAPLQQRMERVEDAVRGIVIHKPIPPDLSRVLTAIAAIPRSPPPAAPAEVDLRPLHARLLEIDQTVRALQVPAAPAAPVVDLEPIERRLAALEHAVRTIVVRPVQQVDLEPVLQKLQELAEAAARAAPVAAPLSGVAVPSVAPTSVSAPSVSQQSAPTVRPGSRNLLSHAGFGRADDLQRLKGVKKVMERMLHDIGVYYFWQIAEWTDEDAEHADAQLAAFHGRIKRDKWVEQAATLAAAPGAATKPAAE